MDSIVCGPTRSSTLASAHVVAYTVYYPSVIALSARCQNYLRRGLVNQQYVKDYRQHAEGFVAVRNG